MDKGVYKDIVSGRQVKESRISSIVPFLKEAIREYSDLQIGVVKNLHSKEWIYNMKDCTIFRFSCIWLCKISVI